MTLIGYRNEPEGLFVEDSSSKKMVPLIVSCDKPYLLIFTGKILKELTNGNVKALKHQVMTNPEEQHREAQRHPHQWRFTLSKFTYCNTDILQPLMTTDEVRVQPPKQRKHQRQYPLNQNKYFMDFLATEKIIRENSRVTEFPESVSEKYPQDVKYREMYAEQLGKDSLLTL
jgi:isopenicillin N synthase-like dioxygenase